jgi:hypothetical protein
MAETTKEHDVDYSDPAEESKGTFEKKVIFLKSYTKLSKIG